MNALKKSFAPLVGEVPAVLILGTLPGERSLAAGEYYAHSANRFWSMIAHVTDEPVPKNYEAKKQLLAAHRIALWDVAHSANCARNNTEMIASWGQIKEFVKSVRLCAKISGCKTTGCKTDNNLYVSYLSSLSQFRVNYGRIFGRKSP